jgi:predicted short-subunit dehydrogenase-like oxidoreductase (DUF2520 family)
MASNFLVALVDAAAEALAAAGVDRDEAPRALVPLLAGTVENLGKVGLPGALTGPIARGDAGTVTRHLRALEEHAPQLLPMYKVLGRRAVEVARRKNEASPEGLAQIDQALT